MLLSIIIPAYNEEKRIGPTLVQINSFLKNRSYNCEILVIDDGSADNTMKKAEKSSLFTENKSRVISNGTNGGKGFSVKNGILNSHGEYVLISDADLSTPIEEVDKLFKYIDKGFDIAIGSRSVSTSEIKAHQPWHRERMGRIFNFFVRKILVSDFNDTQCGFKLFKGNIARAIAAQLKIDGFSFDVEMLYIAKQKGYKIAEVGVMWNNSAQSTVRVFGSSLNMLLDLLKIKSLHR
ncbi:MAG: glycosyltransferase family 2 protein [Candidatus Omnitrophota bacterium]|nr:glycosyltransferase family 2 protein [Candidatus Omnitrophota bacterium]